MRVKIFILNEGVAFEFENQINEWLYKNITIDIFKILQSETEQGLTISIFYTL